MTMDRDLDLGNEDEIRMIEAEMAAGAQADIAAKAAAGAKFTDDEVDGPLADAAKAWLATYRGNFEFLTGAQYDMGKGARLSTGRIRGILNCMVAELKRAPKPAAAAADTSKVGFWARPLRVNNGYYTVVLEDGSHRTIRVLQAKTGENREHRQMIGLLTGPVNTSDYTRVGKLEDGKLTWFRGYGAAGSDLARVMDKVLHFTGDEEKAAGEMYAVASKNCWRCGALLTDDQSIAALMGPTCRNK